MARPKQKKFHIRVRREYVAYYTIEAEHYYQACSKADERLSEEMNDQVDYSFDCEEFDPKDFQ